MISFIVPAYNEEFELPSTVAAVHAAAQASGEAYEIIVVDDDSSDATAAIATQAGARVIPVRRRQIAAARNAGGFAAHGDTLFFVDADTRIAPAHVTGALAALRDGAAGGGAMVAIVDEIPRWARIALSLFTKIYFAANLGAGAFLFTSREIFRRTRGFDEQYFAGEEIYFTQALKKVGKFVLLREPVLTSGRKLRLYSCTHLLRRTAEIVLRGERGVRSRAGLDVWYDGKRETELLVK